MKNYPKGGMATSAVEVCSPSLEERMSRCYKQLSAISKLVDGLDAVIMAYGDYWVWDNSGEKLYAMAVTQEKRSKGSWKALKKEAKQERKKK